MLTTKTQVLFSVVVVGTLPFLGCSSAPAGDASDSAAEAIGHPHCAPTTCVAQLASCGTISDHCGHALDCGTCTAPETCGGGVTPNVCERGEVDAGPPVGQCTTGSLIGLASKCLDANGGSSADGTKVQLWDCDGTSAQEWTLSGGQILGPGGKCLDITGNVSTSGTPVELWDCWGGPNQQWSLQGGQVVGLGGKCLDITGADRANGTQAQLWDCNGTNAQQWRFAASASCGSDGGTDACTPITACPAADNCGSLSDGCGGMLDCGSCTTPLTCGGGGTPNVCGGAQLAPGFFVATDGNDSWSGTLASPNSSNTDGPFASVAKAQAAMQGSSTKLVYLRAGTYSVGVMNFTSADTAEVWNNYPSEAPVLDGGGAAYWVTPTYSSPTSMTVQGLTFQNFYTGTGTISWLGITISGDINFSNTSNITFEYNTFNSCYYSCVFLLNSPNSTIDNNTVNGTLGGGDLGSSGPSDHFAFNMPISSNSTISHNSFYNLEGGAIVIGMWGTISPMNDAIDSNYVNTSLMGPWSTGGDNGDSGSIYVYDLNHGETGISVTNNVVLNTNPNDYSTSTGSTVVGLHAFYFDGGASNITMSGNICQHCGTSAVMFHGGNNVTIQNNIFDISASDLDELEFYQTDGGNPDYGMAGNVFTENIIYTSGSATGVKVWLNQTSNIDAVPAVSNNLYYAAQGGVWNNSYPGYYGGMISDSSPVYSNPGFANPAGADYAISGTTPSGWVPLSIDQGPLLPRP